jgi:hypothetical protein
VKPKLIVLAIAVAAAGILAGIVYGTHESTNEQHVLTFVTTFNDPDPLPHPVTVTDTQTVTVTQTVTATTPTTTTTPPPSGAITCTLANRTTWGPTYDRGECSYATLLTFTNQQFICTGPLSSYGPLPLLLRWNFTGNPDFGDQGHLSFRSGCRGDGIDNTIDVIVESNANGLTLGAAGGAGKFQTAGPVDIQITGEFNSGPLGGSAAHQDVWQFHPTWTNARLDIINGVSGNWAAGTSTTIGAGGSIFYSYPYDVDVYGGRYVTCNHGLFGSLSSVNEIVDVQFRAGRIDGSDPKCAGINSPPLESPCPRPGTLNGATLTNVTCQRWNPTTDTWIDQEGY